MDSDDAKPAGTGSTPEPPSEAGAQKAPAGAGPQSETSRPTRGASEAEDAGHASTRPSGAESTESAAKGRTASERESGVRYNGQAPGQGRLRPTKMHREGHAVLTCGFTEVVLTYTALHNMRLDTGMRAGPLLRDTRAVQRAIDAITAEASMGRGEWLNVEQDPPAFGQRCIIWDSRYRVTEFAYYHRDNFGEGDHGFSSYQLGQERRLPGVDFWKPDPGDSHPSRHYPDRPSPQQTRHDTQPDR